MMYAWIAVIGSDSVRMVMMSPRLRRSSRVASSSSRSTWYLPRSLESSRTCCARWFRTSCDVSALPAIVCSRPEPRALLMMLAALRKDMSSTNLVDLKCWKYTEYSCFAS